MNVYIYGVQPVLELLRRRPQEVEQILLSRELFHSQEILQRASQAGLKLKTVSRQELDRLTGTREHQGVVAFAPLPQPLELEDLLERIKKQENSLLILLDQITDPQNLGAIIRTAEGAGADAVISSIHKSAKITPAVLKASSGALEWLPFSMVTNLTRALEKIKKNGFWVYATSPKAQTTLWQTEFSPKSAVIIGSEHKGIRPLVAQQADFELRIPLFGKIQSLNASASTAIVIYEYQRQRQSSKKR